MEDSNQSRILKQFRLEWSNEDPRYTVGKHAQIMIYDQNNDRIFSGYVDTKEVWCIWTTSNLSSQQFYSADDNWPNFLWWTYAPRFE